jgi:hypothetical protein
MITPLSVVGVSGALGAAIGTTLELVAQREPGTAPNATVLQGSLRLRPRVALVGGGTGLLFAAVTLRFGMSPELPAYLYLAAIGLACTVIDVDVR